MIRQKLPNFLLEPLLNFILYLYLSVSQIFNVDINPSEKIDDTYTRFNSFNDPLPKTEPVKLDYQKLLAQAEDNGDPIEPVNRHKPLTLDVHECPRCGLQKSTLEALAMILMVIKS